MPADTWRHLKLFRELLERIAAWSVAHNVQRGFGLHQSEGVDQVLDSLLRHEPAHKEKALAIARRARREKIGCDGHWCDRRIDSRDKRFGLFL